MSEAAIAVAFFVSVGSIAAHISVLIFKEQRQLERVIDVIFICINAFIMVGLWPLVWGGAA